MRRLAQEADLRHRERRLTIEPTDTARRRIERQHEIISEQFVLVAQHRSPERVVNAILAQVEAVTAGRTLKAAQKSGQGIAAAEANFQAATATARDFFDPWTTDDKWWATAVTLLTILLLANGRYGILETFSTVLVVLFTFITIGNSISLQGTEQWRLTGDQFLRGLSFHLPEGKGLTMALATFGIIGVGATELITYPYWCIEKGYARFTGWRSEDPGWVDRARGWIRVMHWDAFLSMVIYTVATIAFYLMGAAVLHSEGRDPDGMRMVSTLATAYVPVFGEYAKYLFLVGAIAVLYSTFLVANAGHSRMFTDGLKVFGFIRRNDQKQHDRAITALCVLLPLICLAFFWGGINPVQAVAFAGMMQATMLPMIGFGALYWRYTATDPRLAPPRWWDVLLVLSFVGLLVVGVYGAWDKLAGWWGLLVGK
ncbi:MAG: Nramp family divalent metal transporter [Planctomycetaceae bacterium]